VVVSPTLPILPFKLGEKINNPMEMYLSDTFTVNINLAGVPAISVPAGFSKEGLPIGMQFIGDKFSEDILFRFAYALEQELKLDLDPWKEGR
jgi:aspartyl-tRNA(Asn)/glutamyl-tRNA(Gln) amidotransferase subunit A